MTILIQDHIQVLNLRKHKTEEDSGDEEEFFDALETLEEEPTPKIHEKVTVPQEINDTACMTYSIL